MNMMLSLCGEDNHPILELHDSCSEGVWSIFVKRKGNYSEYVSRRIASIINFLGYVKIVLKSDQEHSIRALCTEVQNAFDWHLKCRNLKQTSLRSR